MDWLTSLLRCPSCGSRLRAGAATTPDETSSLSCEADARHRFEVVDRVVDFLRTTERSAPAEEVTGFYRRFPFPGYAPTDDAGTLLERSRRAPFLASLDASIPADARVLDAGCGTGQLAAFLALAAPRRRVVGVDACDASLAAAAAFRARVGIDNLRHLRADLFHLPLPEGAFDVVVSRGVVHHTEDPPRATREVAARVAPGGTLLLGFYESVARLPHRARRAIFRMLGRPVPWLDPILRRRDVTDEKKRIWIEDQYRHPLERLLPAPRVLAELEAQGFRFSRSVPPGIVGSNMLVPEPRPGAAGWWIRRLGWAASGLNDPDAGLICLVARRGGSDGGDAGPP